MSTITVTGVKPKKKLTFDSSEVAEIERGFSFDGGVNVHFIGVRESIEITDFPGEMPAGFFENKGEEDDVSWVNLAAAVRVERDATGMLSIFMHDGSEVETFLKEAEFFGLIPDGEKVRLLDGQRKFEEAEAVEREEVRLPGCVLATTDQPDWGTSPKAGRMKESREQSINVPVSAIVGVVFDEEREGVLVIQRDKAPSVFSHLPLSRFREEWKRALREGR